MTCRPAEPEPVPAEPDIDDSGVDRAQIRQMLDLSPAERMLVIEGFPRRPRPTAVVCSLRSEA